MENHQEFPLYFWWARHVVYEPFIYSVADMFNTVLLPLRDICPFTSFGLLTLCLHPIPKSCFGEPLNSAGPTLCSFEVTVRYLERFSCSLLDESCWAGISSRYPLGSAWPRVPRWQQFTRELSEWENQDQITASLEKNVALKQTLSKHREMLHIFTYFM